MKWSEDRDEYEDDESYGYEVRDNNGHTLSFGETRQEALDRAIEKILLPKEIKEIEVTA